MGLDRISGRIEILVNGTWGSVCGTSSIEGTYSFGYYEARSVCRILTGYALDFLDCHCLFYFFAKLLFMKAVFTVFLEYPNQTTSTFRQSSKSKQAHYKIFEGTKTVSTDQ